MGRRLLRALACVGLAVSFAACAVSPPRERSTLVVLEPGDAGTMNPLFSNQEAAFLYQGLVFDFLVNPGRDYGPVPALATSWRALAGGKTWVVTLRRGVRWSDGRPFTATDVVWTMNAMLDPKTGSPYQAQNAYVKRVVALDPYTVRFDLDAPNATFMANILQSEWIMPEHVLGAIPHAQLRTSSFGEHPVGTGRYRVVRWQHDQELLLEANPLWWGGPIAVKRIDFRVNANDNTRTDAMIDGTADVDDEIGETAYDRLRAIRDIRVLRIPDLFTRYIQINFHVPALADVSVRRAMLYGWDRYAFAAGLLHGGATVASSVLPTGMSYWHDFAVKPYPYDRAKANALLDAAGWRRGRDGVRRKSASRLAFTLLLPNATSAGDIAADFQADMRAIGIDIRVRMVDYATFIDETNLSHYELAFTGFGGDPDPDYSTLLASDQVPPNGNNTGFYRDPAVDRDLRLGVAVVERARRRVYYNDMQVRTARDVPVLFGTNEFYRVAYRSRVHPVLPALPNVYFFDDVQRWRLDP